MVMLGPRDQVHVPETRALVGRAVDDQRRAAIAQGQGDQSYSENVLLPVAPWPVALAIVSHVLPGVDLQAIPLQPVPERARRRS